MSFKGRTPSSGTHSGESMRQHETQPGEGGGPGGGRVSSPTMWPPTPPASRPRDPASRRWVAGAGCRPQRHPENDWGPGVSLGHLLLSGGVVGGSCSL